MDASGQTPTGCVRSPWSTRSSASASSRSAISGRSSRRLPTVVPFGLLRLAGAWSMAAFLGFRMARLGVFVEEDGIRVRNPLKTKSIPWSEVRGFVLSRSLLGEFGIAELHNGRSIRLWGIQSRSRVASPRDRRAELAIGSLNLELQVARGHGSLRSERGTRTAHLQPGAPSARAHVAQSALSCRYCSGLGGRRRCLRCARWRFSSSRRSSAARDGRVGRRFRGTASAAASRSRSRSSASSRLRA